MLWAKFDVYGYICNIRERIQQYKRKKAKSAGKKIKWLQGRGPQLPWLGIIGSAHCFAIVTCSLDIEMQEYRHLEIALQVIGCPTCYWVSYIAASNSLSLNHAFTLTSQCNNMGNISLSKNMELSNLLPVFPPLLVKTKSIFLAKRSIVAYSYHTHSESYCSCG